MARALKRRSGGVDNTHVSSVTEGKVGRLPVRRVSAGLPSTETTTWTPSKPEFSAVANGLSLLMPALEPFVMKAIRTGAANRRVSAELGNRARTFILQEAAHQQQHREFNRGITDQVPVLKHVEQAQRWLFRTLDTRSSTRTALAHAAGAEAVAFFTARWVDRRRHTFLADASGAAASMFVWHLAEEVEHKDVAYDIYRANGGGRGRYLLGILSALVIFAVSIVATSAALLIRERQWWKPRVHVRMVIWSLSFVFEVLPLLGLCIAKDHHPKRWSDPEWLGQWLDSYDRRGGVAPDWDRDTLDGIWNDAPNAVLAPNEADLRLLVAS